MPNTRQVTMTEGDMLARTRQLQNLALTNAANGRHQEAYEAFKQYNVMATAMETTGVSNRMRAVIALSGDLVPAQAQSLSGLFPENFHAKSRGLGVDWSKYDAKSSREYWLRMGAEESTSGMMSQYFAGDLGDSPQKALRAAEFARHLKPGPTGDIDAVSIKDAERRFGDQQARVDRFSSSLNISRPAAAAVAEVQQSTGLHAEALHTVFTGIRDAYFDGLRQGRDVEHMPKEAEVESERFAQSRMDQITNYIKQHPGSSDIVARMLEGGEWMSGINWKSQIMREERGLETILGEVVPEVRASWQAAARMRRDGELDDESHAKLQSFLLDKYARPGTFGPRNPKLEEFGRNMGEGMKQRTLASESTEQAARLYASESPDDHAAADHLMQKSMLSLGGTDEGLVRFGEMLKQRGFKEEDIPQAQDLLRRAAPLASIMGIGAGDRFSEAERQMLAARLNDGGVQSATMLRVLESEMESLLGATRQAIADRQVGAEEGAERVAMLDDNLKRIKGWETRERTRLGARDQDLEAVVRRELKISAPPIGEDPQRGDVRRLEEGMQKAASARRSDVGRASTVLRNATTRVFTGGKAHVDRVGEIPLKDLFKGGESLTHSDGSPLRLEDLYTEEQLNAFLPGPETRMELSALRGATTRFPGEPVTDKSPLPWQVHQRHNEHVEGLVADIKRRGLARYEVGTDKVPRLAWSTTDTAAYTRDPTAMPVAAGEEAAEDRLTLRLGEQEFDPTQPGQYRSFVGTWAPGPLREQILDSVDKSVATGTKMRRAQEARDELVRLGVPMAGRELLETTATAKAPNVQYQQLVMSTSQRDALADELKDMRRHRYTMEQLRERHRNSLEQIGAKAHYDAVLKIRLDQLQAQRQKVSEMGKVARAGMRDDVVVRPEAQAASDAYFAILNRGADWLDKDDQPW